MKREKGLAKFCKSPFPVSLPAFIAFLILSTFTFGQSPVAERPPRSISNENYRIGPGDILDVVVSKNDTLSRTGLRVSNQGTIQLAMLEYDVPAACLTERQLADAIKDKYRKWTSFPLSPVSVSTFSIVRRSEPSGPVSSLRLPPNFLNSANAAGILQR